MKVLQITPFYFPDRGGIETYVRGLAEALVSEGIDTTVLTTSSGVGHPIDEGVAYPIVRCPRNLTFFKGVVSVRLFIRILRSSGFDVLHLHIPFPLGLEVGGLQQVTHGTPLIATHHGEGFSGGFGYRLLRRAYWGFSSSVSYQMLRLMIFLTRSYASSIRLPVGLEEKIRIVPGGVDVQVFSPLKASTEVRSNTYRNADFVVLFVASLSEFNRYKGLDILLQSFAATLQSKAKSLLVVIGEGPLRRSYEALAEKLGISGSVVFAGEIPDTKLPLLMASADAFVMPSVSGPESYGLAVLEAMASGVPPIVTNLPGLDELVTHSHDGLVVQAGNRDLLRDAIEIMRDDQTVRRTLARNARTKALGRTWNHVARTMARVYAEAIP